MCFSLGNFDVAVEVGVGFFTFGGCLFGDQNNCVSAFNSFGGAKGFTSTLCQEDKIFGGGNFLSHFLGDGMERGIGTGIGVNYCGNGGNNGARLLVASVSGRISMWSWGGNPWKWRGVHPWK